MVEGVMIVQRHADAAQLHDAAAKYIVQLLHGAVAEQTTASIAVCGGSTPKSTYELLAAEPFRSQVEWNRIHFFWGDERCVPPDHPDSSFRMMNEALLSRVPVPHSNIHRIEAERPPERAASLYEKELQAHFNLLKSGVPRFDVVLLGLGEDGHTASLFPGTKILDEQQRLVAESFVPKWKAYRISMTLPTINNAKVILFLVSGEKKREILRDVLEGEPHRFPAQRIQPTDGKLLWFVDESAATMLQKQ